MSAVTVRLVDGSEVVVEEPVWCNGHHEQDQALVDLFHEGPETGLTVETRHGRREILLASLVEYPHRADPARRGPWASVLLDGEFVEMDPGELRALASRLVVRADDLRDLARDLAKLRRAGGTQ